MKSGRPRGQKDTGVETTYGKAQCGTATCQVDRRPHQDCGESLDAGGIGPVTLEINWGGLCSAVDSDAKTNPTYSVLNEGGRQYQTSTD